MVMTRKLPSRKRTKAYWWESGRLSMRVESPTRLAKLKAIAKANGDCGPTTAINILLDAYEAPTK